MSGVFGEARKPCAAVGVERKKRVEKLDNLTLDAIEAEKHGMSYGYWKSQNQSPREAPHLKKQKPKTDKKEHTCPVCGKTFYTTSHVKIYCSMDCQRENKLLRSNEKKLEAKRDGATQHEH